MHIEKHSDFLSLVEEFSGTFDQKAVQFVTYARKIQRSIIVDVLEDRKLITAELAHDVRKIFDIRDHYAHKPSINEVNVRTRVSL